MAKVKSIINIPTHTHINPITIFNLGDLEVILPDTIL